MIISYKYKYLFIAIPHTASSSVSRELCENYYGQPILRKHKNYFEFERIAGEKAKKYFVFAGVRNPLDGFISYYLKYLYNRKLIFTNVKRLLKEGGNISKIKLKLYNFVQDKKYNFSEFLKKFYTIPRPYTDNININKAHCNYIIRFERLNECFSKVLKLLKIAQVSPLPNINKILNKKNYIHYYDKAIIEYTIKIFGPFMLEWGYKFPKSWSNKRVSYFDQMKYELYKKINYYYNKYISYGNLKYSKSLREIFG